MTQQQIKETRDAAAKREGEIRALEEVMMQWVTGEKSHWNSYSALGIPPGDAGALCSIADACEVQKYSLAIQALRSMR